MFSRFQISVIIVATVLVGISGQVQYASDCNDPMLQHNMVFMGHSYCDHACYPNVVGPHNICTLGGMCLCGTSCDDTAPLVPVPPVPIQNTWCPLIGAEFENPTDEANCRASCAGACPGGTGGQLCKENEDVAIIGRRYRICTCVCPNRQQPCGPDSPVVPGVGNPIFPDDQDVGVPTTGTTTTTPAPTKVNVIVKVPNVKKILKKILKNILPYAKKLLVWWWILTKVAFLQLVVSLWLVGVGVLSLVEVPLVSSGVRRALRYFS